MREYGYITRHLDVMEGLCTWSWLDLDFVCRLQCPFSLRSGRGSVSLTGLFLLGRIITEVITVNPVALLGGTLSPPAFPLPGCLFSSWPCPTSGQDP